MSTTPLSVFCTTLEGLKWSILVAEKLKYEIAFFSFVANIGFNRINKEDIEDGFKLRIFILDKPISPTQDFDDFVDAHAHNIAIDIKIGGFTPPTLLLSQFDIGRADSPAAKSALSWLKRHIRSDTHFGVIGTNQTTGGSSSYKGIGYTQQALALLNEGGVWRHDVTSRSTFKPIAD